MAQKSSGNFKARNPNCLEFSLPRILDFVGEVLSTACDPAGRRNARDFSRGGTLSPDLLVVLLLLMAADGNRRGYRHFLDTFWDECATHDVPLPTGEPVSASAFCQARGKLSSDVLRKVLREASRKMEATFPGPSKRPQSFDFLGFTHLWARSRRGSWVVKQLTAATRLRRALRAVSDWCRRHRHLPIGAQREALSWKLRGHCAYYGITRNSRALWRFRTGVLRTWRKWLMRLSNAARKPWSWWHRL